MTHAVAQIETRVEQTEAYQELHRAPRAEDRQGSRPDCSSATCSPASRSRNG